MSERPGNFNEIYPYASQQACKAAIKEQGLTNHYASGGSRNGVERYQIAEWQHEDKHGVAPAHVKPHSPVAERKPGAKNVCREVFEAMDRAKYINDKVAKAAFVDECTKRGVFPGTSKARWSDLVKGA